jgi:hypothetical protein
VKDSRDVTIPSSAIVRFIREINYLHKNKSKPRQVFEHDKQTPILKNFREGAV